MRIYDKEEINQIVYYISYINYLTYFVAYKIEMLTSVLMFIISL